MVGEQNRLVWMCGSAECSRRWRSVGSWPSIGLRSRGDRRRWLRRGVSTSRWCGTGASRSMPAPSGRLVGRRGKDPAKVRVGARRAAGTGPVEDRHARGVGGSGAWRCTAIFASTPSRLPEAVIGDIEAWAPRVGVETAVPLGSRRDVASSGQTSRGPPGDRRRCSTRSRNRPCSTCCAPASPTLGSRRCATCSTRASTTARHRQCTGSCGITASRATPASTRNHPATSRGDRTEHGVGVGYQPPRPPAGVWFYLYRSGTGSRETGWCVDTTETAAPSDSSRSPPGARKASTATN